MTKAKPEKAAGARGQLRITLVRSLIGFPQGQRVTAKGLGLGKIDSSVVRPDTPEIRGMINKIVHLVKVEVISQ